MGDGKQPRKRNDYTEQLRVDGKQFRNAAEFCREYDMGYRTVVAHLKKGHSGAEIVRTMLELPEFRKRTAATVQSPMPARSILPLRRLAENSRSNGSESIIISGEGCPLRKRWNEPLRHKKRIKANRMVGVAAEARLETAV